MTNWLDLDTPKYVKKAPRSRKKKFGIERYSDWLGRWYAWKWYPTEERRDQALEDSLKHWRDSMHNQFRKVDR